MSKRHYCDGTHLTLEERRTIQIGIENRATKTAIAKTIGKDPTTIAKEIRKHRIIKPRNTYGKRTICIYRKDCHGCDKTEKRCERYKEEGCKGRDKSPGACNKCPRFATCKLTRYLYDANLAHEMYSEVLVDTRVGVNLDKKDLVRIADILVPLVNQGQSIYQILQGHPEINLCSKSIYNYIDQGLFKEYGLDYFSLKEKLQRKRFKKRFKKRTEPANYENRRYKDFLEFTEAHPEIPIVEMDTVYNNPEGPYIQTFMFRNCNFMIGFIHQDKTAISMAQTLNTLERILGTDDFISLFPLILTDRGSEFAKPELFEYSGITGEFRLNIFYCDALHSWEKPHVENNHNYLRDIIPNGLDLRSITNENLQLVFTHINNTPRSILNGKTPYDLFEFFYSKTILDLFGIKKLHHDEVILKPYLLKL